MFKYGKEEDAAGKEAVVGGEVFGCFSKKPVATEPIRVQFCYSYTIIL